ncbi:cytochrome P460 family protein (plasmid) [Polymorphobacter sp. PAMC 29334]|uniref:cytochrome P460 family protein n=1 Tax=Polymorphobacter sp. PAMC 29334 TaxID=2862331 RepID=UPI001C681035|nr:cytochrome P460 family protein [Polymorphobacter sp. PAMC 29334]QYE33299.1 cytochrome P460 family protein [Polymorphobacter sp. PAMC 29334]
MRLPHHRNSALAAILLVSSTIALAAGYDRENVSPEYGVRLPGGYRNWKVVSVAHEAGGLDDIRVILGNNAAVEAMRSGRRPFPNGAVLVRVAWKLVPSERNNAIFGRPQSFVPGSATNVQVEVKDSRKFRATGGWGYGQFEAGRANGDAALINTCNGCHLKLPKADDLIFTQYALDAR